jgi:hypothetical protein
LIKDESRIFEQWNEAIPIILQSATVHSYYRNLSVKKRKAWLSKFILDSTSSGTRTTLERNQLLYNEFAKQPYAGCTLFFLLFDEYTDNHEALSEAYENAEPIDFICQISLLQDAHEKNLVDYFDINRRMKMAEKFDSEECVLILEAVID